MHVLYISTQTPTAPLFHASGLEEVWNPQAYCLISQRQRKASEKSQKIQKKISQKKNPKPNLYENSNSTNPPSQLKSSRLWLLTHKMSCKVSAWCWRLPLLQHPQTPGWLLQPPSMLLVGEQEILSPDPSPLLLPLTVERQCITAPLKSWGSLEMPSNHQAPTFELGEKRLRGFQLRSQPVGDLGRWWEVHGRCWAQKCKIHPGLIVNGETI